MSMSDWHPVCTGHSKNSDRFVLAKGLWVIHQWTTGTYEILWWGTNPLRNLDDFDQYMHSRTSIAIFEHLVDAVLLGDALCKADINANPYTDMEVFGVELEVKQDMEVATASVGAGQAQRLIATLRAREVKYKHMLKLMREGIPEDHPHAALVQKIASWNPR